MIFKKLYELIRDFYIGIFGIAASIFDWCLAFFGLFQSVFTFVVGLILALLSLFVTCVDWLPPMLVQIQALIDNRPLLQGGVQIPSAFTEPMSFLNSFVPLTEGVQVVTFGFSLMGLAVVVRMLKSLIPTVN